MQKISTRAAKSFRLLKGFAFRLSGSCLEHRSPAYSPNACYFKPG